MAKRTPPPDAKKLEQIALDYYCHGCDQENLAREHGVKQPTIARWLKYAELKGVVHYDIDGAFALTGRQHAKLSKSLRDQFHLEECIVVDPDDPGVYDDAKSDKLHTIIANTAGERIVDWIREGDHIVVGGGRAPVRVARYLRRAPSAKRDVRISPLSGRIWTGSWQEDGSENLQRPLDADDAARLFALAYERERGTRFSQIGHPLYARNPSQAQRVIDEECVFSRGGKWKMEWGLHEPARAIVGIGVLHRTSGHRISELLNSIEQNPEMKVAQHLKQAAAEFREAINLSEKYSLPAFGDVANRLFPALPLPHEWRPSPDAYDELHEKLEELNRRAVVMEWAHLRKIQSVWALAGGLVKLNVIWTLLISRYLETGRNDSVVTELSTDVRTARRLEEAMSDFRKATYATRHWYQTVCENLFTISP